MSNDRSKAGYKQTAIRLIPEDWNVRAVGDICDFIVPGRNKPKIFKGDIPWITTPDLEDGRSVSESKVGLFVSREEAKSVGSKIVPAGAVLMSCVGELGIVAFAKREIVINQQLHAFIPSSIVDPFFLLNALQAQKNFMLSIATLTAVPYLNKDNCNSIPIPLPPLPEQRSLAQALSDVDALIAALEKAIAKQRDIRIATMQQLLTGKKRLPGFGEGKGYQESEVGVIPEDWLSLKIGDLFSFKNGLNKAKEFFGSGTPIVNYMDVFQHPGLYKTDILGKVTVSADEIRSYGIRRGDVFFTRTSETVEEIGIAAVLLEDIEDGVFSGFVLRARPKTSDLDLDLPFKKYCFDSAIVRKQITSTSSYTTRALTNGRLLSQVILPCPSKLEEQRAIAAVLSDMDGAIAALENRLTKTQAIKQGMMQELLTGRIRLV